MFINTSKALLLHVVVSLKLFDTRLRCIVAKRLMAWLYFDLNLRLVGDDLLVN